MGLNAVFFFHSRYIVGVGYTEHFIRPVRSSCRLSSPSSPYRKTHIDRYENSSTCDLVQSLSRKNGSSWAEETILMSCLPSKTRKTLRYSLPSVIIIVLTIRVLYFSNQRLLSTCKAPMISDNIDFRQRKLHDKPSSRLDGTTVQPRTEPKRATWLSMFSKYTCMSVLVNRKRFRLHRNRTISSTNLLSNRTQETSIYQTLKTKSSQTKGQKPPAMKYFSMETVSFSNTNENAFPTKTDTKTFVFEIHLTSSLLRHGTTIYAWTYLYFSRRQFSQISLPPFSKIGSS